MFEISMQAAFFIYTFCFFIGLFIVSVFYFYVVGRDKDYLYFVLFFLLSTIGSLLIYFRLSLDYFWSIIIAYTFLFIANILLVFGIRKVYELSSKVHLYIYGTMAFVLAFLYFTYVDFNVMARIYVYNLSVMFVLAIGVYSIYNAKKSKDVSEIMTVVLSIIIVFMGLRIFWLSIENEAVNSFFSYQKDPLNVAIVGAVNLFVVSGMLSIINDKMRLKLIDSERSKTSLISNISGYVYRANFENGLQLSFISDGFEELTGYKKEEVLYKTDMLFGKLILDEYRESLEKGAIEHFSHHLRFEAEYQIRRKNGAILWVMDKSVGLYDSDGKLVGFEGFITSIDSQKKLESKLEYLSFHDGMTGLYNRRFFEEEMNRVDNERNLPVSIILGDINGLKLFNDTLGHENGDKLIKACATIIKRMCRADEIIARWGGDEFAILLPHTSTEQSTDIVNRINEYSKSFDFEFGEVSIALGIGTKADGETSIFDVFKEAESAMYRNKQNMSVDMKNDLIKIICESFFKRYPETKMHSKNVSLYASKLAKAYGLDNQVLETIERMGIYHDIGLILVDNEIKEAPRKLTEEEYDLIKQHSFNGSKILSMGTEHQDLVEGVLHHHEWYNGNGYPDRLKGDEIPIESRIIAIADAFDTMISERVYKKNVMTLEEATEELLKCKGTQFEGELVDLFIEQVIPNIKD